MKKIRALEEQAFLEKNKSAKKSIHTEESVQNWENYEKSSISRSRCSNRSKSRSSRYIKTTNRINTKSSMSLEKVPKVSEIHQITRGVTAQNRSVENSNSFRNVSIDSAFNKNITKTYNDHARNKTPNITKNQDEKKTAIKQAAYYKDNKNSLTPKRHKCKDLRQDMHKINKNNEMNSKYEESHKGFNKNTQNNLNENNKYQTGNFGVGSSTDFLKDSSSEEAQKNRQRITKKQSNNEKHEFSYNFSRSMSRENSQRMRDSYSVERNNEKLYKKYTPKNAKENKASILQTLDSRNNVVENKPQKSKVSFNNHDEYHEISPKNKSYGSIKKKAKDISQSMNKLNQRRSRNKSTSYREFDGEIEHKKSEKITQQNENKFKTQREEFKKRSKKNLDVDKVVRNKDHLRTYDEESYSSQENEQSKLNSRRKLKRRQKHKENNYKESYDDQNGHQQYYQNNNYQGTMNSNQNMNFQQFPMNQQQGYINGNNQQQFNMGPQGQMFGYNMGAQNNMQPMGMINNPNMMNMQMNGMGMRQMGYNGMMYNHQPMPIQQNMFPSQMNYVGMMPPYQGILPNVNDQACKQIANNQSLRAINDSGKKLKPFKEVNEFEDELLQKRESNNQRRNELSKKFNEEFNNINTEVGRMHDLVKKRKLAKSQTEDEVINSKRK